MNSFFQRLSFLKNPRQWLLLLTCFAFCMNNLAIGKYTEDENSIILKGEGDYRGEIYFPSSLSGTIDLFKTKTLTLEFDLQTKGENIVSDKSDFCPWAGHQSGLCCQAFNLSIFDAAMHGIKQRHNCEDIIWKAPSFSHWNIMDSWVVREHCKIF